MLPHYIFTRGKMNNAIKRLKITHFQNVTFRRQTVAKTTEISTFNNYRTVFCSNYCSLTCHIRTVLYMMQRIASKL